MGYVYFDKTGLYFDYDENSRNDARNAIDDARKWFVWTKLSPGQRDMNQMETSCEIGKPSCAFWNVQGGPRKADLGL